MIHVTIDEPKDDEIVIYAFKNGNQRLCSARCVVSEEAFSHASKDLVGGLILSDLRNAFRYRGLI
jgi:hypothetical protein